MKEMEKEQVESSEDSCVVLVTWRLKEVLKLILEQHGFEVCGFTYTRISSSSKYYSTTESVVDGIPGCGGPLDIQGWL